MHPQIRAQVANIARHEPGLIETAGKLMKLLLGTDGEVPRELAHIRFTVDTERNCCFYVAAHGMRLLAAYENVFAVRDEQKHIRGAFRLYREEIDGALSDTGELITFTPHSEFNFPEAIEIFVDSEQDANTRAIVIYCFARIIQRGLKSVPMTTAR